MVKSKLLYGGDIWWATKKDIGKLETVQNDFIRWISGLQRKDKVSVSNLRKEMHIKSVEDSLCIKSLIRLGGLTRMDGNRLVSRVWGKRALGGQRQNCRKIEREDLAKAGWSRIDALKRLNG
jgi:predicted subunit of tRNA(5-methylaminomethyl-2-thiouridylate) methyltransferase